MEARDLFKYDQLIDFARRGDGKGRLFLEIIDQILAIDGQTRYKPFEETGISPNEINQTASLITEQLRAASQIISLSAPGDEDLFLDQFIRGGRNLRTVAAIGLQSSAISNPAPIHIEDVCGGSGILSLGICYVREGVGRATSSNCLERDPQRKKNYHILRNILAPTNKNLQFIETDIRNRHFGRQKEKHTYVLAKHPCGNAPDHIINNLGNLTLDQIPEMTLILNCCYGKAQNACPFIGQNHRIPINEEAWKRLTKTADWTGGSSPERVVKATIARRIIDLLRILNLPPHLQGKVIECMDPSCSPYNHALVITPA